MQKEEIEQIAAAAGSVAVLGMLGYLLHSITRNIMGDASFNSQALLPQAKMVTVICPICAKEIEIPDYPGITRTDALLIHIQTEHPYPAKSPGLYPQVLIEGGDRLPVSYRHLAGWLNEPLPGYSLLTDFLPAVEVEAGE
ncbi:hypothetical protein ACFLXC_04095, partial [Chloroflexota bacterium]